MRTAPAPNARADRPRSPADAPLEPGSAALADARAEHEVVAKRLEARRSIEHVRRGAIRAFAAVIAFGFAARLAWDRWAFAHGWTRKPPLKLPTSRLPLFFLVALAAFLVLVLLAFGSFRRARALMREEDADFARLRELRARLGLDR